MGLISGKLKTYSGSYVARRRKKRLIIALVSLTIVALAAVIVHQLSSRNAHTQTRAGKVIPKREILADWNLHKWGDVRSKSAASSAVDPLDTFYLTFRGLAAFYEGIELPEGEERTGLIDECIVSLRKAMVIGGKLPLLPQVQYVLGKAYYEKGDYYMDEAAAFIESAGASGYKAKDSSEYLALAYSRLGEKAKAVSAFETALANNRTVPLLLAAAKACIDASETTKAEALLLEAISSGGDDVAVENGLFLLGDIYRSRGDFDRAIAQYSRVLEKNPDSAEAHYRLGLIWQSKGDPIKARAEWRKAVSIDPMHAASRQKLAEKL
jgi:tetratricopeptide (TPR) repeat protein